MVRWKGREHGGTRGLGGDWHVTDLQEAWQSTGTFQAPQIPSEDLTLLEEKSLNSRAAEGREQGSYSQGPGSSTN